MNETSPIEEAIRSLLQVEAETNQLVIPMLDALDGYLGVLRAELPRRLLQAVFLLATQHAPDRYESIRPVKRQNLQQRLQRLAMRCSCLLTVEQLLPLAQRLQRKHLLMEEQSRASEALGALQQVDESTVEAKHPPQPAGADITLELNPPIASAPELAIAPFNPPEVGDHGHARYTEAEAEHALRSQGLSLATLSSLLGSAEETASPQDDGPAAQDRASMPLPGDGENVLTLTLPRDPQWLERWSPWIHQALSHRLRNLSHAVNVELLKLGLIRALLPVNLLDAVSEGDVEVMAAPPNLLQIAVPIGSNSNAPQIVTRSVFLRLQDMEFECLPMRRCRKQLDQYQQHVQQLAKRSRHWQKNLVVAKAASCWHEDIQQPQP